MGLAIASGDCGNFSHTARRRCSRLAAPPSAATYSGKDCERGCVLGFGSDARRGKRGGGRVPLRVDVKTSSRVGKALDDEDEEVGIDDDGDAAVENLDAEAESEVEGKARTADELLCGSLMPDSYLSKCLGHLLGSKGPLT